MIMSQQGFFRVPGGFKDCFVKPLLPGSSTAKAPENFAIIPKGSRIIGSSFKHHFFRGYVKFREGAIPTLHLIPGCSTGTRWWFQISFIFTPTSEDSFFDSYYNWIKTTWKTNAQNSPMKDCKLITVILNFPLGGSNPAFMQSITLVGEVKLVPYSSLLCVI